MGLCPQGRGRELIDSAEWIPNKNGKMAVAENSTFAIKYMNQGKLKLHLTICTLESRLTATPLMRSPCYYGHFPKPKEKRY